ncbi:MAG: PqqD family protein [Candidatus Omnitrophica bacterium]|nr:PqqD family protein [Candidatus Omnitrophota bacterium]
MKKTHPMKNPDIVARTEKEEALLFSPADGNLLCINKTGILVWDLCDGKNTADDIAGKIADTFEVESEVAKKDSLEYLEKLKESGFIGFKA